MMGTDVCNIYISKTIKINTLEQNTQVSHNYKLWVLLSPSKINRYLADACCGTAQPGTVGNIKKIEGSLLCLLFHILHNFTHIHMTISKVFSWQVIKKPWQGESKYE